MLFMEGEHSYELTDFVVKTNQLSSGPELEELDKNYTRNEQQGAGMGTVSENGNRHQTRSLTVPPTA